MPRSIPSGLLSQINQPVMRPFYAVDLLFDAPNQLYFHTGLGNKTIGSTTYQGLGDLMSISAIDESGDLTALGAKLMLNGANQTIMLRALAEPYQNRVVNIYFGLEGSADVIQLFTGFMDVMNVTADGESGSIELTVESHLIKLQRNAVRKYTHESQVSRYPSDTAFSYITTLQEQRLEWGKGYQP